jgi:predicted ATPase/DNA-binding CsgD family transcriptional regulator
VVDGTALVLQAKPIIGREQELAVARERLAGVHVRLLTLTGPPGVGKTRLALELAASIADQFESGVVFVDLAAASDATHVNEAIARGLGLRERGRRTPAEAVEDFLRDRSLLLMLDNLEQVPDAAQVIRRLLGSCPALKVVATSRARLHLRWESLLPVAPLGLPDLEGAPVDAAAASPAVQLFVERARAVAPGFVLSPADAVVVGEICTQLDGLPLAIELAAARIKLFPPRALLDRLLHAQQPDVSHESALRILSGQAGDLPPRQQTLLRAIAWSYDLLEPQEQALFQRLAVFVGGCSLEAAAAVGDFAPGDELDAVAALVDKSLVWQESQPDGELRIRMLETIAEFAREQLAQSGNADAVRSRRAAYYVDLAEEAASELVGPRQHTWLDRLDRERDNLRVVERWAIARGDADTILRLGAALWPWSLARADASEARDRLAAILPLVGEVPASLALAGALHGAGMLAEMLGDYGVCRSLLEFGLVVARQLGNDRKRADLLDGLGRHEFIEGRLAEARPLLEESHAILLRSGDRAALARVLSHLGFLEYLEGHAAAARATYQEGLALAEAAQDQHLVAEFKDNLGRTFEVEGDFEHAAQLFEEAVAIWRDIGNIHWLSMALNNLGRVQARRGELGPARRQLHEGLRLAKRIGDRRRQAFILSAVAVVAAAEGRSERAQRLDAIASSAVAEIGARPVHEVQARLGPPASVPRALEQSMTLDQAVEENLAWLAEPERRPESDPRLQSDTLTRREREVVVLLARGMTNRQIGEALIVTEGTVENYVQRVLGKLRVNNRAQVAVWAVEHGLANSER